MLTYTSATDASATEVTRASEEQTVTADVDREYVHTIYTGSTYCCVTEKLFITGRMNHIQKQIFHYTVQ